ncbi:ATP-binding protein [Streptomyces sp. TRM 70361]|uniref:ATP-binding protein n=1 Tax=Streptomyces sp. TRM 70361 TaxID=3116553 RepID=UPI002E7AEDEA|nr:ATP-binding protein [Streptomyces sp. TRM 70361]MEE1939588.1 ATP-binding protein [Streptomyces sp. TRM 70361]
MTVTAVDRPATAVYRLTAPAMVTTPRVAREAVTAWLRAAGHGDALREDARVLVSEVVTNTAVHTAAPRLTLEAEITDAGVRVRVWDGDQRGIPRPRERCAHDEGSGRGLRLVEALGHTWGVTWTGGVEPAGKRVWFELHAAPRGDGT